jgi:Protein of unknown function (DUF3574)
MTKLNYRFVTCRLLSHNENPFLINSLSPVTKPLRPIRSLTVAVCLLAAASEVRAQVTACASAQKPQQVAELLFGRKIGDRLAVSQARWARFVDREITPRFPDGLTVLDARGQWRDTTRNRIVREPSKLVQIVLPGRADDFDLLNAIAEAYKKQFHQQSVGVIVRGACVSF